MGYTNYATKNYEIISDRNRDREIPENTNPCGESARYYRYYLEQSGYQNTIKYQPTRYLQNDIKWW